MVLLKNNIQIVSIKTNDNDPTLTYNTLLSGMFTLRWLWYFNVM